MNTNKEINIEIPIKDYQLANDNEDLKTIGYCKTKNKK